MDGAVGCPVCDGPTVVRPVPAPLRERLPEDPALVRLCESCLSVSPAPGQQADRDWDPTSVSGALPADPAAAVAVAMLVHFLSSIALHRADIEAVIAFLEAEAGVDPLLTVQRLRADDAVTPATDLERREQQLGQLLGADD